MADPTSNLPQITNFVPRWGGAPPPAAVPVPPPVNAFVPRYSTAAPGVTTGARIIPAAVQTATPAVPVAPTPAAVTPVAAPAPAAPVAPPAVSLPVSATPGEGNPLPPSMRGGATSALPSLPSGPVSGAPTAATQPAFPVLNASALQGVFNNGAGGGSQIAPGGIEVDRGGTVSRYDQGGNLVSGPGTPEEAAYNRLLAANPAGGTGALGTAYAQAAPGAPGAPGAYGGVGGGEAGGIRDPQAAIAAGFGLQDARAQNYIGQAMQYVNGGDNIFERATRARFVNGLLGATVGPNNAGQVAGQGADTLNSALAGVQAAGIGAGASEYGANLGLQANEERIQGARQLQTQQIESNPVVIGTRYVDNGMGYRVPQSIYGLGTADQNGRVGAFRPIAGNGMVISPQAAQAPANPAVGTTRTRASGATERFDGKQWVSEK
jgi:hypothetical protein